METKVITIKKPKDTNIIIGQSHFIKTVEDLYEALVGASPGIKFGIGFCESSGDCLVRHEGNDELLRKEAARIALEIGAGHSFVVLIKDAFPINVLNAIKGVPEVCRVFCATANPLEVILARTQQGRGVIGVIDGASPKGIEDKGGISWRKEFLRKIGYKL
jgi:hypothetical protein